jgi:spermidine/putrescine-binding protein
MGIVCVVFLATCGKGDDTARNQPAGVSQSETLPLPLPPTAPAEVVVLNWADYIPESVFRKFQEKYGIVVHQVNFSSELEMQEKLQKEPKKFDVTVANGGLLSILIRKKIVQEIDLTHISNIRNIAEEYLNKSFDPGNRYSVPFMVGYTGLIVNTEKVKTPITSYADLWNPKFAKNISFCEDMRSIIGAALKKMGHSAN